MTGPSMIASRSGIRDRGLILFADRRVFQSKTTYPRGDASISTHPPPLTGVRCNRSADLVNQFRVDNDLPRPPRRVKTLHSPDETGRVHQQVRRSGAEEIDGFRGKGEGCGKHLQADAQARVGDIVEGQLGKGEIGGNRVVYLRHVGTFASQQPVAGVDGAGQLLHLGEMPVDHVDAVKGYVVHGPAGYHIENGPDPRRRAFGVPGPLLGRLGVGGYHHQSAKLVQVGVSEDAPGAVRGRYRLERTPEPQVVGEPAVEQMKERARQAAAEPVLNPSSREPLRLKFAANTNINDILTFIGQASGINILYDRDVQNRPSPSAIDLDGVTLEQALNIVLTTNGLFYKVMNEKTILIIPDNATKRQQYEEQVIRTFYISNGDVTEMQTLLNAIMSGPGVTNRPMINASKTANTITVRGSDLPPEFRSIPSVELIAGQAPDAAGYMRPATRINASVAAPSRPTRVWVALH